MEEAQTGPYISGQKAWNPLVGEVLQCEDSHYAVDRYSIADCCKESGVVVERKILRLCLLYFYNRLHDKVAVLNFHCSHAINISC